MAQKRRPANDRAFKKYKTNNQRLKNKIRKIQHHIKKFPDDKLAKENLARIEKNGISDKMKPRTPGINSPGVQIKCSSIPKRAPKTAGEQLRVLLGITVKKVKSVKTKTFKKRKKNVKPT